MVFISFLWRSYVWSRDKNDNAKKAILLRRSLEKLGSIFIKLGQMLALRPDIIADVYCNELYKLLDRVPPFPIEEVEKIIYQELGSSTSELFDSFDFVPVASASFAQVHKAKLKNGSVVAVKVQRPNIRELVNLDLALLRKIAWIIDILFKPSNKLSRIVEEFESWTKGELDYEIEAANIQKFNEIEGLVSNGIRGPKVYKKLSSTKILTMEFIDGYSLTQIIQAKRNKDKLMLNKLKKVKFNGNGIIKDLIRNTLEMSHVHGFFHADPHPANIIFTNNGELIFIDFGIVGVMSKRERILILRYFRSMLSGNSDASFNSLVSLCEVPSMNNIEVVKKEYDLLVKKLVATFEAETYLEQQKKSGPILVATLNLLQRNGFVVPVGIVRYFKAFETVEGLIFALYPELAIKNMMREFRRVSIINIIDSLTESLEEKRLNEIVLKLIDSIETSIFNL